jgi:hypothetical protein
VPLVPTLWVGQIAEYARLVAMAPAEVIARRASRSDAVTTVTLAIEVSDWFKHTPLEVLAKNLGVSPSELANIPRPGSTSGKSAGPLVGPAVFGGQAVASW